MLKEEYKKIIRQIKELEADILELGEYEDYEDERLDKIEEVELLRSQIN